MRASRLTPPRRCPAAPWRGRDERDRAAWGDERQVASNGSWPAAAVAIAGYGLGFGIAMRFFAAWRRRQELVSQEADDALD